MCFKAATPSEAERIAAKRRLLIREKSWKQAVPSSSSSLRAPSLPLRKSSRPSEHPAVTTQGSLLR